MKQTSWAVIFPGPRSVLEDLYFRYEEGHLDHELDKRGLNRENVYASFEKQADARQAAIDLLVDAIR